MERQLVHRAHRQSGDDLPGGYHIFDVRLGGMGVVYCVSHPSLAYRFAVKTFQGEYLLDSDAVERFRREASAWIRLGRHPHLVQAIKVDTIDNKPHLFLEYVGGGNLAQEIAGKGLPLLRALDLALQVCDGLIHVQRSAGVVHRDIKPSNILIASDGRAQITDFGLVSAPEPVASGIPGEAGSSHAAAAPGTAHDRPVADDHGARLTATGCGIGTPVYMPPEQWRGIATVRSDVYAFGITLYEMLCGRPPFVPGRREPIHELRARHVSAPPPDIRAYRGDVPDGLVLLLSRCLEKQPESRPADFVEVRDALLAIYAGATGRSWQPPPYSQLPYASAVSEALLAGMSYAALGNVGDAISEVRKALDAEPANTMAVRLLGKYHHLLGENARALTYLEPSVGSMPDDVEGHDLLAVCLNALERHGEALEHARTAARIDARSFSGWNNMAVALAGLALQAEIRALGSDDEARSIHTYTAGLALMKESLDALETALSIEGSSAESWNNRGYALGRCGRVQEAVGMFRRSIGLDPRAMQSYLNLSEVLFVGGDVEEAVRTLDRARAIDPADPRVQNTFSLLSRYLAGQGRNVARILETPCRLPR